jgi:hypothetical protein
VVKLADAPDSKSGGLNARVGSIPSSGTNFYLLQAKGDVRENSGRRTSRLFVAAVLTLA